MKLTKEEKEALLELIKETSICPQGEASSMYHRLQQSGYVTYLGTEESEEPTLITITSLGKAVGKQLK